MRRIPEAERSLVQILATRVNPTTGRRFTDSQLGNYLGINERTVGEIRREYGMYKRPLPDVEPVVLPPNERAFYLGMAVAGYKGHIVPWSKHRFVSIETQGNDNTRRILKRTIGTRGDVHDTWDALKIYLHPSTFDYLTDPQKHVASKFLDAKSHLAPFLAAVMALRLSERGARVSLPYPNVLQQVYTKFEEQFGFSLGRFKPENPREKDTVFVDDPTRVILALTAVDAVRTLPFFRNFAHMEPRPSLSPNGVIFTR